jgi:hypothetical protein
MLRGLYRLGAIVALAHLGACSSKSNRTTPAQYPQQPYPQQPYPQQQGAQQQYPQQQGQPYPQQPYPQQQGPQQPYPQQPYPQQPATQPPYPQQPATQQPIPTLPGATALDPINTVNLQWLRQRAQQLLTELVAALPADSQQRVQGIPLIYDDKPGEVNAFAACSQGRALMAVTDEMLRIMDFLAQSQANDERFGTRKVDELIRYVGQHQQPDRPLALPGTGFFDVQQQLDAQKVNRQHQLFDEQLAFVLGHELAHHHLGHLPCTARPDALGTADIARALSDAVPLFNQPNELAADVAGTTNVLNAGKRSTQGYAYTENGGLLTMRFFAGLDNVSVVQILFDFEASHPAPQIRAPVIQQAAATWRFTGGQGLPVFRLGG